MGSNRSYPPLVMQKEYGKQYLPYQYLEARREAFEKAGVRKAWVLDKRNELIPVLIHVKKGQNFTAEATPWEQEYSKLVSQNNRAEPVISEAGDVIAHFGWFHGKSVAVPRLSGSLDAEIDAAWKYGDMSTTYLNQLVKRSLQAFVASRNPMEQQYKWLSTTDQSYELVCALDGQILAHTNSKNRDGAIAESITPLDLIMIVKVVYSIGKAGAQMAISSLGRKGSQRVVGYGMTKEAAEAAAKEAGAQVGSTAAKEVAEHPAVVRAVATQANLQNQTVQRGVGLITSPQRFRHTITADVPASSFANIEKEGALRFSTGAKAHYGDGVYVWGPNGTTSGKYIDIEVGSGVAVESIAVQSGSWFRLVTATGTKVPVKIVGHNFTKQEIDMGRKLIE